MSQPSCAAALLRLIFLDGLAPKILHVIIRLLAVSLSLLVHPSDRDMLLFGFLQNISPAPVPVPAPVLPPSLLRDNFHVVVINALLTRLVYYVSPPTTGSEMTARREILSRISGVPRTAPRVVHDPFAKPTTPVRLPPDISVGMFTPAPSVVDCLEPPPAELPFDVEGAVGTQMFHLHTLTYTPDPYEMTGWQCDVCATSLGTRTPALLPSYPGTITLVPRH